MDTQYHQHIAAQLCVSPPVYLQPDQLRPFHGISGRAVGDGLFWYGGNRVVKDMAVIVSNIE